MIVKPVSVSVVTQAVEARLRADPALAAATITRSDEINAVPSLCPWIGVYRADCAFPQRTLGVAPGWRGQRVQVMVLAQEADGTSGAACEDRLNELVDAIIAALLADTTLGGAVHAIDDLTVRYPDYRRVSDAGYLQTAMIIFTALTTVGGIQ